MKLKTVILLIALTSLCTDAMAAWPKRKAPADSVKTAMTDTLAVPLYSDEYLDTVKIRRAVLLNDYSTIGFEYGVSRNSMRFNPKFLQKNVFFPEYYGITYTKYCKMLGYMPYFGFQIGAFYGHEGYEFKMNEETGGIFTLQDATKVEMDYAEIPLLAEAHLDLTHLKFMLDVGPYAGYRLNIHRSGPFAISPAVVDSFVDYERQIDYGVHGGAGFSIVFAPVEFQVRLRMRYSLSSLWEPDYNSKYYYRFAYPFDFMLTGGVAIQLNRRYGKTKAMMRREARDRVFNPPIETEQ